MLILLNYTETDHCTYFISSVKSFEAESLEALYCHLLDLHDQFVKQHNIDINSSDYSNIDIEVSKDTFVPLSEISPDMSLMTLDDYVSSLSKEAITLE